MSDQETPVEDQELNKTIETPPAEENSAPAETEEAAPSDDSNESPEESEPKEAKKKSGFQKRIDEITRQRYEADARAAQLEQELTQLRQQTLQDTYQSQKPTLEAFNYDQEAWAQAMEKWAEQGFTAQQEQRQREDQQRAEAQRQAEISRRVQEQTFKALEKYPDFQVKVNDPSLPALSQVSPAAYEALVTSENMGEVAYYLANNPAEIYGMGSMSPIEAVRAIARLETKLTAKPKTTTNAPPPPSQVNGKAESVVNEDKLSTADWMKRRRQHINQ